MDELRSYDDVRAWLATNVYAPDPAASVVGRVGIEAELFPFWIAPGRRPAARLALVEIAAIVDELPDAARNPDRGDGRPSWQLHGATITEEPGAQLEVADRPHRDAHEAVVSLERIVDELAAAFADAGAGLVAAGIDHWSADDEVPVQLEVPRYDAMTAYFGKLGGRHGHLLMCSSCSLQVNLDLGPPGVAQQRWIVANLVAPVLTAAFSTSPTVDAVNGRAQGWRGLDPTRTGLPPPLVAGIDDPIEHVLADTWRADVLLVQRDGASHAGEPGWSFGDWVERGHPRFGHPTADDLATHQTTLFPEARLRGYLEVRSLDVAPAPWRAAAIALVTGLLYDTTATDAVEPLLLPHRAAMPQLLERAARDGVRDPVVGPLAVDVLEIALGGADRLGLPESEIADAFLDRYTRRGRQPADELEEAMRASVTAGFSWGLAGRRGGLAPVTAGDG